MGRQVFHTDILLDFIFTCKLQQTYCFGAKPAFHDFESSWGKNNQVTEVYLLCQALHSMSQPTSLGTSLNEELLRCFFWGKDTYHHNSRGRLYGRHSPHRLQMSHGDSGRLNSPDAHRTAFQGFDLWPHLSVWPLISSDSETMDQTARWFRKELHDVVKNLLLCASSDKPSIWKPSSKEKAETGGRGPAHYGCAPEPASFLTQYSAVFPGLTVYITTSKTLRINYSQAQLGDSSTFVPCHALCFILSF